MGPALTSKSLTMMTPRAVGSVKELVSLFEAKRVQAEGRPFNMAGDFISAAMVSLSPIELTTGRHQRDGLW